MADEHVLRIEFDGGDDNNRSLSAQGSDTGRQLVPDSVAQTYRDSQRRSEETSRRHDERQRNQYEEDLRSRVESGSDEPLPHGDDWRTNPQIDEVDETPYVSQSRDLVPYDAEFANRQYYAHTPPAGSTTQYGAGPTAAAGAGAQAAAAGGGGFGGGVGGGMGVAAAGAGGAAAGGGFAGGGAALGSLAIVGGEVAIVFVALAAAAVGAAAALTEIADGLLSEFEELDPILAQARAEQEAELIQYRQEVAPEGGAEIIAAETEFYEALIDMRAELVEVMGPALIALLKVATAIMSVVNFILDVIKSIEKVVLTVADWLLGLAEHIPLIARWAGPMKQMADKMLASLEEENPDDPKSKFAKEAEDFLNGTKDPFPTKHRHSPIHMPTRGGRTKRKI